MADLIQQKIDETPDLLTIGEVSKLFNIHPDTLRNWERSGELVPLRVGPRKDRKYRKADIEVIVAKMGSKLTLAQLEQFLWRSADILRGKIDSSDYKKYIFGLLFYKRISDVWDEEYQKVMAEYNDKTLAEADYNHRFQVPKDCKWSVLTETSENIGQRLNEIFDKITNVNSPKLDKIFDDLDFANKDRFPNETLQRLINHFSQYNFGSNYISSDLLGDAYEYLIKQFAADAGKKGGEFYTPREVERVIIGIVKPHQKDHIYDPTVGSGGFLLEAYSYLKDKAGEQIARTLYLYGQEINISTFAIAKINMFLHGLDSADIRRGDTLANPQFLNQMGNLQTYDIVVANPPYSIKDYEWETYKTDKYGRTEGYDVPPQKNADYAFVLHILKSMNVNGRAGVVLPHGVLFREASELRIRQQIIKDDLIEAVIALPPKLFYGTSIPAAIVAFNKNKRPERKGKVLFIDGQRDFLEGKNQNFLRKQDIQKIINTVDSFEESDGYSRVVNSDEIASKDYNLSVKLYISQPDLDDFTHPQQIWSDIEERYKTAHQVFQQVEGYIRKIRSFNSKNKWVKVRLDQVVDQFIVPMRDKPKIFNGDIPWCRIEDFNGIYLSDSKSGRYVDQKTIDEMKLRVYPINTVLVSCSADLGRCAITARPLVTNQTFIGLYPSPRVDNLFLYYLMTYSAERLNSLSTGTTIAYLSRSKFESFEVLIPEDVNVQKQIAKTLFEIDQLIDSHKTIVSLSSGLKNQTLKGVFSNKIEL